MFVKNFFNYIIFIINNINILFLFFLHSNIICKCYNNAQSSAGLKNKSAGDLVVFFDLYDFKNHRVKWPGVEQQKEKDKQESIRLDNRELIALQEERIQEERRRMEGIIKEDANHCLPRW